MQQNSGSTRESPASQHPVGHSMEDGRTPNPSKRQPDAAAVARLYFELSNARDLEAIPPLLHPDIIYTSGRTGSHRGREAVMRMMTNFFAGYRSIAWTIESLHCPKSDTVEIVFLCRAETAGGREETRRGHERIEVATDGRIARIDVHTL